MNKIILQQFEAEQITRKLPDFGPATPSSSTSR